MRHHRVQACETLSSIAQHYYGDHGLWVELWHHNKDIIANPNQVPNGLMIVVPHLERVSVKVEF